MLNIIVSKNLALEGRVIRRLVCLTERVDDMVAEFDRRIALGASDISEADVLESSDPTYVHTSYMNRKLTFLLLERTDGTDHTRSS
jgi:hypothetical protein